MRSLSVMSSATRSCSTLRIRSAAFFSAGMIGSPAAPVSARTTSTAHADSSALISRGVEFCSIEANTPRRAETVRRFQDTKVPKNAGRHALSDRLRGRLELQSSEREHANARAGMMAANQTTDLERRSNTDEAGANALLDAAMDDGLVGKVDQRHFELRPSIRRRCSFPRLDVRKLRVAELGKSQMANDSWTLHAKSKTRTSEASRPTMSIVPFSSIAAASPASRASPLTVRPTSDDVDPSVATGSEIERQSFAFVEEARVDRRVLMDAHAAVAPVRRGDEAQACRASRRRRTSSARSPGA